MNCYSASRWLFLSVALLFCLASTPALQAQQQKNDPDGRANGGSLSELQKAFDISYYDIEIAVFPDEQRIRGEVVAQVYALEPPVRELELDLVSEYEVSQVSTGGSALAFRHEGDKLFIELGEAHTMDSDTITPITIEYSGHPPVAVNPPWQGGFTWSEDESGAHWVGLSCQLEGAQIWLPVKNHPVSRADSLRLAVDVPRPYTVAANGVHQQTVDSPLGGDRHVWEWKTRYPTHNYNINFTMGMFERHEQIYKTTQGTEMPVVFYVQEAYREQAGELLEMTVKKLQLLRHYYGEYGFTEEKFGLVHTPYLGMEHQTINAYGNGFEYTTIGGRSYDWLLLHEMGHEWWGNLITVEDWAEFWIHEGITTFTDALFLYDFYSPEVYYAKMEEYTGNIRNEQAIIPGQDLTSAEVYNHDVYYKGAYFMHTLMHLMDRPVFLEAIRSFAEANRYGYTSTAAFIRHFQKFTTHELRPLFNLYLYDVRLPRFRLTETGQSSEGMQEYSLRLENAAELQQAHGQALSFPVEIQTSEGTQKHTLGADPIQIQSQTRPVVDPRDWYLKASMFE
jgi:aminopeptidase N